MTTSVHLPHDWYPRPIPSNVEIGTGSWLYSSFAFLHCQSKQKQAVRIGKSTGVYDGSFFELGPEGQVTIGDFSTLVGAIICSNGKVLIGSYVFIAHEVVFADEQAARPSFGLSETLSGGVDAVLRQGKIVIEDNVWIGARATLLNGAHIGTGSIVGACTVVDFQVPQYSVVTGDPARIVALRRCT